MLKTSVNDNADQSTEYFSLLTRLLNYTSGSSANVGPVENLLHTEIAWLKRVRQNVKTNGVTG